MLTTMQVVLEKGGVANRLLPLQLPLLLSVRHLPWPVRQCLRFQPSCRK
jgi:hypothetical protein